MEYPQIDPSNLTLRDSLAKDRTVLANERTLLSYIRTGFGLAAGGVTLLKLFPEESSSRILGLTLLISGIAVICFGVVRFVSTRRRLNQIEEAVPESEEDRV